MSIKFTLETRTGNDGDYVVICANGEPIPNLVSYELGHGVNSLHEYTATFQFAREDVKFCGGDE